MNNKEFKQELMLNIRPSYITDRDSFSICYILLIPKTISQ